MMYVHTIGFNLLKFLYIFFNTYTVGRLGGRARGGGVALTDHSHTAAPPPASSLDSIWSLPRDQDSDDRQEEEKKDRPNLDPEQVTATRKQQVFKFWAKALHIQ